MKGDAKQMVNSMEMICPLRLRVWGWHAVVNFIFGGIASGMFLLGPFLSIDRSLPVRLLPPALAGLGFCIVAFEAGHPLRAPYLLFNLRGSWMSREIVVGGLFIVFGSFDAFFQSPLSAALAGAAALGLIVSQGFIVFRSVAVRAWNIPLIPAFFLTSGLWGGFGLMFVVCSLTAIDPGGPALIIGLVLASADFLLWMVYLRLRGHSASGARSGRIRPSVLFTPTGVVGYLVPAAIIVILTATTALGIHNTVTHVVTLIAGLSALTGNALQKSEIILGDNYLKGIVMGRQRGGQGE